MKNPSDPNHHGPKNRFENSRFAKLNRLRGVEILHLFSIDASIKTSVEVLFFSFPSLVSWWSLHVFNNIICLVYSTYFMIF